MVRFGKRLINQFTAQPRPCVLCGETKPPTAFLSDTTGRERYSMVCQRCRNLNADAEKEWFQKIDFSLSRRRADRRAQRFETSYDEVFIKVRRSARWRKTFWKGGKKVAQKQAENLIRFPDRVAEILAGSYAVQGDEYEYTDDEALQRLRDILEELDSSILDAAVRRLNAKRSKRKKAQLNYD